jgi:hypothetical protein
MSIQPIETTYKGCRFRSRLEARWAVFFDALGIRWQYELEGFQLSNGVRYLPDFLLVDCGTWVEVKGAEGYLDRDLMLLAARELPHVPNSGETGPRLMVLGPVPDATPVGDWGWIGIDIDGTETGAMRICRHGFGSFDKKARPWFLDNAQHEPTDEWLTAKLDEYERGAPAAYRAARAARFEYGESGVR